MEQTCDLSGDLKAVAEVIGRQPALYLVSQCKRYQVKGRCGRGQIMLLIPKNTNIDLNHHLVRVLGYPLAQKLVNYFAGELLRFYVDDLVIRARNAGIRAMYRQGYKQSQLAEIFQLTTRTISYVTAG